MEGVKLEIKSLQILLHGIMMLLTIIELKGDTLFGRDDVGIFSLLGLSLAIYFVTGVAFNFTKVTSTSSSIGALPILIWHLSFMFGSLSCVLLSSIIVPHYGWFIFILFALPFSMAPCKPHLRIKPLLRILRPSRLPPPPPRDTHRSDEFISIIIEERPLHHPSTPAFEEPFASQGWEGGALLTSNQMVKGRC